MQAQPTARTRLILIAHLIVYERGGAGRGQAFASSLRVAMPLSIPTGGGAMVRSVARTLELDRSCCALEQAQGAVRHAAQH